MLSAGLSPVAAAFFSGTQQVVAAAPSQASADVSAGQSVVTFEGFPLVAYLVEPHLGHPHWQVAVGTKPVASIELASASAAVFEPDAGDKGTEAFLGALLLCQFQANLLCSRLD